ncbi:MAG TPA: class I SAM-dependent methyltransferase [Armatimonadota bacterium]|nr:class I SAM-dependent methyltransferase [Armatimonadota bacterium]
MPKDRSAGSGGWVERIFGARVKPADHPSRSSFQAVGPYYDYLMSRVPYRHWVDYVEEVLRVHNAAATHVLDLACGTGMVGCEMIRRGYTKTVGVDLSEGMVRVAFEQERLPVAVHDARALGLRENTFDLVLCLYDSLNYVTEPTGLRSAFESIYHCLTPGGMLIFDLNTIRALELDLFTQNNLRSGEPLLYSWKSDWDAEARICSVQMWFRWRDDEEENEFTEVHRQRGYTDDEVQGMLRDARLEILGVYDAYSFEALNPRSTRMFFVARKPLTT